MMATMNVSSYVCITNSVSFQCYEDKSMVSRLFGGCDVEYVGMRKCLKSERLARVDEGRQRNRERTEKMKERLREMGRMQRQEEEKKNKE